MKRIYTFAIDFDGTCVSNDWPNKTQDIGAVPVLKKIIEAGHNIMIYTSRQNYDEDRMLFSEDGFDIFLPAGNHLKEALEWFDNNEIPFVGVNWNPCEANYDVYKPHFDFLIDDKAIGIPTTNITVINDKIVKSDKQFVDWDCVELILEHKGLI